jgi:hypothetical protein
MMRRAVITCVCVAAAFLVVVAAAAPAHALCPNCIGQASSLSRTLKVVGAFLLVPPAIFFAVTIAIRRLGRRDAD